MCSIIKAVLFDVFETLLYNRYEQWDTTFEDICRSQRLPIDPKKLHREWRKYEGRLRKTRTNLDDPSNAPPFKSYFQAWRDCFQMVFKKLDLPGDAEAAAHIVVQDLAKREPYPDAVAALPPIQARWRTGILSNADDAFLLPPLHRLGLDFPIVLSSERARAYKPDPRIFRQALQMVGTDASETVYVGDSPTYDVLGANLVGIRTAWLNRNGRPPEDKFPTPDYEIKDLTELIPALGKGA